MTVQTEAATGPAALMRAYYAALDIPDLDRLDAIFAPDAEWRFPGQTMRGEQVKRAMTRQIATGLRMDHRISHMLEQGDTAICELTATNTVGGKDYLVRGAVVCEARAGRIHRLVAYPDAAEMTVFLTALRATTP